MDVMTKGDFAALIGVSPGRVSQYISDGKIHGPALAGEGRSARIVVSVAQQQLQRTLEPSQRFGANGAALRTIAPAGHHQSPAAPRREERRGGDPGPEKLTTADELADLRIRRERIITEREERNEQLEIGRYMLAADVRREMAKAVTSAYLVMEQGIAEMAADLSSKYELPQKDVQYALMASFRNVRTNASRSFKEKAEREPEFVEDAELGFIANDDTLQPGADAL